MIQAARGSRPEMLLVSKVAERVAAVRHARALHPRGRTYRAAVTTYGGGAYGIDLLDRAAEYPALARLSRGVGLPGRWPDVLGVAVRVRDAGGPGADLDLLASTVLGAAPLARHMPWPRWRVASPHTTIAGYGTRLGRRYFAVLPDPDAPFLGEPRVPARFRLAVATASGRWRVFGRLALTEPAPEGLDAAVAFNPVARAVQGLRPQGWLWRLRAAAYEGSFKGRKSGV
jgi:hypothetical protein